MKKSVIATSIFLSLLVAGCKEQDNSALTQKLQQAEQNIVQLNEQLAESQQKLTALQQTVAKQPKETSRFPSLAVEIYPFFSKSERITFDKQPNQEQAILSAELYYFVSLAKTGFDWLDNLLARQILLNYQPIATQNENALDRNAVQGDETKLLKTLLEKNYTQDLQMLKQGETLGISYSAETIYLGQRHNIVSFFQNYDEYTGGAHNNYYTKYFNIDVNKKRILSLDDLFSKAKQVEISAKLWSHYEQRGLPDEQGKYQTFTDKADFYISEDFLFTDEGIKFIYPPYALGAFAEGEISLTLPWYEVNQLINPEYQRKPKDGYDLAPDHQLSEN